MPDSARSAEVTGRLSAFFLVEQTESPDGWPGVDTTLVATKAAFPSAAGDAVAYACAVTEADGARRRRHC